MSTLPGKLDLIPVGTRLEATGDGAAFDISASATRTFLCRLTLTDQIEQESLDVSIWGSSDGETWKKKPLLKLPQQRSEERRVGKECRAGWSRELSRGE